MSQLVECVPNFSEGNNQEVRLLWGWKDVWVPWSQEGSKFGVGGGCLSRMGRATAYCPPQRSHHCQLWNVLWMWGDSGELASGPGDFGVLLEGVMNPVTSVFLSDSEVP